MNHVTIEGNLTADPEARYTQGGRAIVTFSVAVNRSWTDNAGQKQEETSFFDVDAWAELGENVADSLHKGDRVVVTGRLKQERWEVDGQNRSKVKIVADSVSPSLRWATATPVRTTNGAGSGPRVPVGAGAPVPDEEPF